MPDAPFAQANANLLRPLSHHHNEEGPQTSPHSTIESLLARDPRLDRVLGQLQSVSLDAGLPYRIVETNSCFGGGQPGVSDTFASALWGLDYMFTLAAFGPPGVNMETGLNQLGFPSSRTPIDMGAKGGFLAKPIYYGMLAFSLVGQGDPSRLGFGRARN